MYMRDSILERLGKFQDELGRGRIYTDLLDVLFIFLQMGSCSRSRHPRLLFQTSASVMRTTMIVSTLQNCL